MMRRFKFIVGRVFCIMAALFLALVPLLQSLHLASCRHDHTRCVDRTEGHDSYGLLGCFHPYDHFSTCSGNACSNACRRQGSGDEKHDPFTCPLCKAFAQLFQSGGFIASHTFYTPQGLPALVSCPNQRIFTAPFLLRHHTRAPPLFMDNQLFS